MGTDIKTMSKGQARKFIPLVDAVIEHHDCSVREVCRRMKLDRQVIRQLYDSNKLTAQTGRVILRYYNRVKNNEQFVSAQQINNNSMKDEKLCNK